MVTETVMLVAVIVIGSLGVARPAFRPDSYRTGRGLGFLIAAWVIFLPGAGAAALGIGAYALAAGEPGAWQNLVIGAVAMACWPVTLLALRRHRATRRTVRDSQLPRPDHAGLSRVQKA